MAQLLHRGVHLVRGRGNGGALHAQAGVVAQPHRGPDRHRGPEDERLLLNDVQPRLVYRLDLVLVQGLVVGFGDEHVQRLVHQPLPAQVALQHLARGLALAKAGELGALRQATVGPFQGALHLVRFDLDLEDDLTIGGAFGGNPHALDYSTHVPSGGRNYSTRSSSHMSRRGMPSFPVTGTCGFICRTRSIASKWRRTSR